MYRLTMIILSRLLLTYFCTKFLMQPGQYWVALLISNIAAIIMLMACIYWPRIGRILFTLLFTWAAFTNWSTVHNDPAAYLEYGNLAVFDFYKNIINGVFALHTIAIVSIIAVCQLLIAVSLLLRGNIFKAACTGGIIFLLAIAPLGIGSGFPATIVMVGGLFMLLKRFDNTYAWQSAKQDGNESSTKKLTVK